MTTETIVKVGEYEVRHSNGADFHALRHGDRWRELAGDNLILALVSRIEQLEQGLVEPPESLITRLLPTVIYTLQDIAQENYESGEGDFCDSIEIDKLTDTQLEILLKGILKDTFSILVEPT